MAMSGSAVREIPSQWLHADSGLHMLLQETIKQERALHK